MKTSKIVAMLGFVVKLLDGLAFAQSPPKIQVLAWNCYFGAGVMKTGGEVKNISDAPISDLSPNVTFRDSNGTFLSNAEFFLDYNPLLPGQTSPFHVWSNSVNPAIATAELALIAGDRQPVELVGKTSTKCDKSIY